MRPQICRIDDYPLIRRASTEEHEHRPDGIVRGSTEKEYWRIAMKGPKCCGFHACEDKYFGLPSEGCEERHMGGRAVWRRCYGRKKGITQGGMDELHNVEVARAETRTFVLLDCLHFFDGSGTTLDGLWYLIS